MNAKWYEIIKEMIDVVPDSAWQDKSLEHMLVLLCDAQVIAANENTDGVELMEELIG